MDDDSVSAEQARVQYEGRQFVLYDLASTNGTFLNGQRIKKRALLDDDIIRLGEVSLTFKQVE